MNSGAVGRFGGDDGPKEVKMRVISVLMAAAVVASCTTQPPIPTRTAENQRA